MLFPDVFYEAEQYQCTLQNTAIPTGVLKNPLDLINSPSPWVMITQSRAMKDPKRKY